MLEQQPDPQIWKYVKFKPVLPVNHNHPYTVLAPANANIAPPGLYMFFVLSPKSASSSGQTMIPSEAKIVLLQKQIP